MSRHISEVLANVLRQLQPKEDGGSGNASAMHGGFPLTYAPPSPETTGEQGKVYGKNKND